MNSLLNPKHTVAEVKELCALTGDKNGAQRIAFTPMWVKTRAWLRKKVEWLPLKIRTDAVGDYRMSGSRVHGLSERLEVIPSCL